MALRVRQTTIKNMDLHQGSSTQWNNTRKKRPYFNCTKHQELHRKTKQVHCRNRHKNADGTQRRQHILRSR